MSLQMGKEILWGRGSSVASMNAIACTDLVFINTHNDRNTHFRAAEKENGDKKNTEQDRCPLIALCGAARGSRPFCLWFLRAF